MSTPRSLQGLNREQCRALRLLVQGPVAVVAGAGTGKTLVITHAAAYLVERRKAKPEQILMLTFTRRAARQVVTRVSKLMPRDTSAAPWTGTFHSFAANVLRQYAAMAELPHDFVVLDREDSIAIIKRAMSEICEMKTLEPFLPRPARIMELISAATNKMQTLEETIQRQEPTFIAVTEAIEKIERFYVLFKKQRNQLDYDDLLQTLVVLLVEHDGVRDHLRAKYRWVLVDEAQDLNRLQGHIVDQIVGDSGRVMEVGDDAQSIYGWRGADPQSIRRFVETHRAKIVTLEKNYRSGQPILDVANAINARMKGVIHKKLYADRRDGRIPLLFETQNDGEEAKIVADGIRILTEEQGESLDEIGVLFRKSRDATWLELELDRRRVPYVKYGGIRFKESAHVKDVVAHLRVLFNPADELGWMRVLQLVPGVGAKTAKQVFTATGYTRPVAPAVRAYQAKRSAEEGLEELAALFDELEADGRKPAELMTAVVTYYLKRLAVNLAEERMKDLDRLVAIAGGYDTLSDLVTELALEAPDRHGGDHGDDQPRLVLSTVHSAKGLEWNHVFVIHAQDKSFPAARADDIEEERRLLYVAVTRAQEGLYVTAADVVSPFLEEIDTDNLFTVAPT